MRVSTAEYQVCYLCHRTSLDAPFYRNRARFNGLASCCSDCSRKLNKGRYRPPSEARRAASKRYYQRNQEQINQAARDRYAADSAFREGAKQRSYRSRIRQKYGIAHRD